MNVTILGAGHMGSATALRLLDTGHRVTVWNREQDRLNPLVHTGSEQAQADRERLDDCGDRRDVRRAQGE